MGHKPQADYSYSAPPVFLFEPHQPEMCNFKPQVSLNIDEVWDVKRRTFEILTTGSRCSAACRAAATRQGHDLWRGLSTAISDGDGGTGAADLKFLHWVSRVLLGTSNRTAAPE
jgi:4-oxalomesaconate hydratase